MQSPRTTDPNQMMRNIAGTLSDDEIEDAIKLADSGGDGEVDYDEFIQMMSVTNIWSVRRYACL